MDDNRARVGLSNLHYEEESLNTLLHLNRLFSAKREPDEAAHDVTDGEKNEKKSRVSEEIETVEQKSLDKAERIRLKNRRAQQKFRDRKREAQEAVLAAIEQTTAELEKARRDQVLLRNRFEANLHGFVVAGMVVQEARKASTEVKDRKQYEVQNMPEILLHDSKEYQGFSSLVEGVQYFHTRKQQIKQEMGDLIHVPEKVPELYGDTTSMYWRLCQRDALLFLQVNATGMSVTCGPETYESLGQVLNVTEEQSMLLREALRQHSIILAQSSIVVSKATEDINSLYNLISSRAGLLDNVDDSVLCFSKDVWRKQSDISSRHTQVSHAGLEASLVLMSRLEEILTASQLACVWCYSPHVIPDALHVLHALVQMPEK